MKKAIVIFGIVLGAILATAVPVSASGEGCVEAWGPCPVEEEQAPEPAPTTTQAPAPTTTVAPAPTTTEAPAPVVTEAPAPAPTTTEAPAPAIVEIPAPAPTTTEAPAPVVVEAPAPTPAPAPVIVETQAPAPVVVVEVPAPVAAPAPTPAPVAVVEPELVPATIAEAPACFALGNRVWNDADADGIQGDDEISISGVAIQLLDADGNLLEETATDSEGFYSFDCVENGDYSVVASGPAGFDLTVVAAGDACVANSGSGFFATGVEATDVVDNTGAAQDAATRTVAATAAATIAGADNLCVDFGYTVNVCAAPFIADDAELTNAVLRDALSAGCFEAEGSNDVSGCACSDELLLELDAASAEIANLEADLDSLQTNFTFDFEGSNDTSPLLPLAVAVGVMMLLLLGVATVRHNKA